VSKVLENFGKYVLLEKLAAGGMAEVYLAKSTGASGINKFVAIKRILPQYSDHPEFIDMFKEEAKIAVNLNHGNVVSIFDFGVEKQQFFLVMEYVEGQNLRQILNHLKKENRYFSIDQIVYMAKEIAAGLDHAHRCIDGTTGKPLMITHRDMSPQNVMVSFEGEVKIVDFGIAKAESQIETTRAGTIKGKFGYMSPEQADGQVVDPRTDIFSLGILMWELLANDRLFTSNSEAGTLKKIRECHIPSLKKLNPSVPTELERIVTKALAKDKGLRYQTAAAFHRDLNRFFNTQYPEFSPHDFSLFMKSAFSNMFMDNRKKLIEFAKMNPEAQEFTFVSNSGTQTETEQSENDGTSPSLSQFSFNDGEVPPDFSDLKRRAPTKKPSFLGTNPHIDRPRSQTASRRIHRGQTATNARPASKSSSTSLIVGVVVAVLGIGGYLWQKNNNWPAEMTSEPVKTVSKEAVRVVPQEPVAPPPGQADAASKQPLYTILIQSNPSGARISIDGQDTGMITPAQKSIEADKEFTIALRKEGHQYYERRERAVKNGYMIQASLLPMPKMGYINLELINGGSNPVVFINGLRIEEKLPLKNYAVLAGSTVKIEAHNPFTGLSADQVVTVGNNQRIQVNLILSQRKPSQEKPGK
jgi:serine/threonine protein kinase